MKNYGLTREAFNSMLLGQGGGCAACGKIDESKHKLCVHHNHETGEIVGILCNACNAASGLLDDNPSNISKLLDYITKTSQC